MLLLQAAEEQQILDPSKHSGEAAAFALKVSHVEGAMISVFSYLAIVFLLLWIFTEAKSVLLNEKGIQRIQLLKVLGLMGLLLFYSSLIDSLVDPFMRSVGEFLTINDIRNDEEIQTLMNVEIKDWNMRMDHLNSGGMRMLAATVSMSLLRGVENLSNYFFQVYIHINLFFVRVLGPLAIAFALFPTFGGMLRTWVQMYFKYHAYSWVLGISILLAKVYMHFFIATLDVAGTVAVDVGTYLFLIGLVMSYLVFKITLVVMGFRMLDNLFGGAAIGGGAMVGETVRTATEVVTKSVTEKGGSWSRALR